MIYKFADCLFDIDVKNPKAQEVLSDYQVCEQSDVDFKITTTYEEWKSEHDAGLKFYPNNELGPVRSELLALQRKVSSCLLQKDAFIMHGVLLEYEGKGYIFTAKSGVGKTTHTRLWIDAFGQDRVTIVNGDKPFIRIKDDKIYGYGTPWCGKERINVNKEVEIEAICFLSRGEKNEISTISLESAVPLLFGQIMINDSANLAKQLELADALLDRVSVYNMFCNMDIEAAHVAMNGMTNKV